MNWKIPPQKSDDLIEQLLRNRGIKTVEEKENFFHPKISDFEKEFQIPGITKALERIEKAIKQEELIIAYGDYDVDGICGAAVLYLGLTAKGAKVLPYIPHREKEGYGLSKVGLDFAKEAGAGLVITTDTGIVAFEMADYAKSLGMDLIITDHHQPLDSARGLRPSYPDAFSIIHSIKLCGAAVSWCLVRQLVEADNLLDLVAIATVADMMSLLGVNRFLVKTGLEKLNRTDRVGLLALFNEAGLTLGQISSYEIGHIIAPRLNAMGRLEHAIDSLRLLCTKDSVKARKLADLVAATNEQRKIMTTEAVEQAKIKINGSDKKIHVLASPDWNAGIIGLVAGRVCDETGCSAIAISMGEEFSKGSARARGGVNIVELIRKTQDILVAVGGHAGAAGFTIETNKIDEFRQRLETLMDQEDVIGESELEIEAQVTSNKLTKKLVGELDSLEPFGMDNPKPLLATMNMELSDLRTVGDGKHLKGKVVDPERSYGTGRIDFIAFSMGNMLNILKNGQLVNIAYNIEIDRYNGAEKLQLKVRDLTIS